MAVAADDKDYDDIDGHNCVQCISEITCGKDQKPSYLGFPLEAGGVMCSDR